MEQQSSKVYYCLPDVKCYFFFILLFFIIVIMTSLCENNSSRMVLVRSFPSFAFEDNYFISLFSLFILLFRYLCAYAYYISLNRSREKSLFVHIPEFDEICTEEVLINIVKEIIRICLDHLKN
ncbi:unnamed protein product [Dracunculus medinensis]|uniref:Uncharacterized protein n=1 Tax=Dracunculus medinensis TaxID=318479 RepID=A0A3P7S9P4_DRAME|nr:unnamed protein product [Dracunculus medinensis]